MEMMEKLKDKEVLIWVLSADCNLKFRGKIKDIMFEFIELEDNKGCVFINKKYVTNIIVEDKMLASEGDYGIKKYT